MKSIVENQKTQKSIRAGMAFRQAYKKSKDFKALLWGFTFIIAASQFIAVLFSELKISIEYLDVWIVSILATYVLFSSFGKARMRYWQDVGCIVQQYHDFYTLNVGSKPNSFDILPSLIDSLYNTRMQKNPTDVQDFNTWWNINLDTIDFSKARLISIYSTFAWEVELRTNYQKILSMILFFSILSPIMISIALNFTTREVILFGFVPVIPFFSLILEEWIENRECMSLANKIRNDCCNVWENVKNNKLNNNEIDSKSIELMQRWHIYRLKALPIFEWLYKLTQKKMNYNMVIDSNSLIEDVKKLDNSI
ncbi:S-4TM family putative pore-forming effector [Psychrobacter celer]|uniref:S-4TM family putative pore-forming effector n=1 Tax=Psychrobacter celer TaxID=306572 RepID=UPI003FD5971C